MIKLDIFEPNSLPGHPSCHAATITELPNGCLLAAWYAGSREGAPDVAIFTASYDPRSQTWNSPQIVIDTPNKPEGNPVLFTDPSNTIWLFYVTMHGSGWDTCTLHYICSHDAGLSWSQPVMLQDEWGWMIRNKPIVLSSGAYLLPAYDERDWTSFMLLSNDGGNSWAPSAHITAPSGVIQPAVVELSDGTLLAYMRCGGRGGVIWQARSHDGGWSWSDAAPTDFPNPNSGIELIKLRDGTLLLIFNNSSTTRTPLSVALSTDEGRTWDIICDIETDDGEFSYPAAIQSSDGTVHIVFTYRRETIRHVIFDEVISYTPG